jgi:hypothetical protein
MEKASEYSKMSDVDVYVELSLETLQMMICLPGSRVKYVIQRGVELPIP